MSSADAILAGVPRETRDRLEMYVAELRRWQAVTNLISARTLPEVWSRHIADSLQLADLADGQIWADLGSGAGFPGLALAIARPGIRLVHLIEADSRRCAFLRHVARVTAAPAQVWDGRIESVLSHIQPRPDVVTARALAPLPELLALAENVLIAGATGLFPKGREYELELTAARKCWRFEVDVIPSRTDSDARILRVRQFGGSLHDPARESL
jgi:16S rRNA (guanine527-N7)-methyltransferase